MAAGGLVILLLVGIIFMVANSVKIKTTQLNSQADVSAGNTPTEPGVKVVYKYLPLDLDTYYRVGDMHTPSKVYYSMFTNNESELTQRTE